MTTINDIEILSNNYDETSKKVDAARKEWIEKCKSLYFLISTCGKDILDVLSYLEDTDKKYKELNSLYEIHNRQFDELQEARKVIEAEATEAAFEESK